MKGRQGRVSLLSLRRDEWESGEKRLSGARQQQNRRSRDRCEGREKLMMNGRETSERNTQREREASED